MKNITIKCILVLVAIFSFAACDTDVEHNIPAVDAPALVTSTPETGNVKVRIGENTITLTYDRNINFATEDLSKITLTGGELLSADVIGVSKTLTIKARFSKRETACTLSIPEGVVLGPNSMPAPAVTISFSTVTLDKTPVNANLTPEAKKVYDYLQANFESKTLSAMMADVAWNTDEAEQVYQWTGKYPAMNCFDYVHLHVSGANWIDYSDIAPVKKWWDNNGLVLAMWHWNVPTSGQDPFSTELWTETTVIPGDWSGSVQLTNEASLALFAKAKVGNKIKVVTSDVVAGAQGSFKNSSWGEIATGTDYFDITGDFTLTITEDILTSLKAGGLIVGGHDYTVTGIYLTNGNNSDKYDFYKEDNSFDADKALTEGTWENEVFTADLAKVAGYLKLLQDANIPVIWRPFHEAAGGWFWWGKNAASFKNMWIAMFDYFKAQGLNNLIWVWTTETGDADWYPGDAYVDIVGRDIYKKETADCVAEYNTMVTEYGNKMTTLSECGTVGKISEQWIGGARWLWFMPWYAGTDSEGAPVVHADQAWWQDAMQQSFVITRDQLPSMK